MITLTCKSYRARVDGENVILEIGLAETIAQDTSHCGMQPSRDKVVAVANRLVNQMVGR
jgi:hypothetical protein